MTIFNLPDLGEGLPDAEIHKWHVKEGDKVSLDDPLVSMETAKAVVEVPSPTNGIVKTLFGKVGDNIKTGQPLVEFFPDNERTYKKNDVGTVVGDLKSSNKILDESSQILAKSSTQNIMLVKVTPGVRALAKQLQVDLSLVTPSGKDGLITAEDVKSYQNLMQSTSILEPLRGMRKSMAITMSKSHSEVVPVTILEDVLLPKTFELGDLTVKIILSIITAIQKEPSLNAWFDNQSYGRRLFNDLNLGIAIDTEEGLFVPVIKKAQTKSALELREEINKYKQALSSRSILPADMQGATFTLTNFGSIAGMYANPIVVPPMVAILGVGKVRSDAAVINQEVKIVKKIPLSLTFDHRAVTGGEAARFLSILLDCLSNMN